MGAESARYDVRVLDFEERVECPRSWLIEVAIWSQNLIAGCVFCFRPEWTLHARAISEALSLRLVFVESVASSAVVMLHFSFPIMPCIAHP